MSLETQSGAENRRVRFASINGLTREDLPIAGELWRDDACRAPWATRETMKIAALLIRYVTMPDPEQLTLGSIERHIQLTSGEVTLSLKLLRLYGAVEAYTVERDEIRVAMHLSLLQRLRVLEARRRMAELMLDPAPGTFTDDYWVPVEPPKPVAAAIEEAAKEPDPVADDAAGSAVHTTPTPANPRTSAAAARSSGTRATTPAHSAMKHSSSGRAGVTAASARGRAGSPQFRAPQGR